MEETEEFHEDGDMTSSTFVAARTLVDNKRGKGISSRSAVTRPRRHRRRQLASFHLSNTRGLYSRSRRAMNTSLAVPGQSSPQRRGGASGSSFGRGAGSKNKTWVASSRSRGNSPSPGPPAEGRWERGGHRGGGRGAGGRAGAPVTNGRPTSRLSRTDTPSPAQVEPTNGEVHTPMMNGANKTWEEVRTSKSFSFKNCHFR